MADLFVLQNVASKHVEIS